MSFAWHLIYVSTNNNKQQKAEKEKWKKRRKNGNEKGKTQRIGRKMRVAMRWGKLLGEDERLHHQTLMHPMSKSVGGSLKRCSNRFVTSKLSLFFHFEQYFIAKERAKARQEGLPAPVNGSRASLMKQHKLK